MLCMLTDDLHQDLPVQPRGMSDKRIYEHVFAQFGDCSNLGDQSDCS